MTQQTRRSTVRRLTVTTSLLAAGLSPLLLAGSAQAVATPATVSFNGGFGGQHLNYLAAAGQSNHLTVTKSVQSLPDDGSGYGTSRYTYTLKDSVTIQAADTDRCTYPKSSDQTRVVCSWIVEDGPDPAYVGTFTLGDENDTVEFVNPSEDTYGPDEFYLGSGKDSYTSVKDIDGSSIHGDSGNDTIVADRLEGDLSGVQGGTGNDTVSVKRGDVQLINGDAGNDTLSSGIGTQYLNGGDGNDLIHGGVGPDQITGGKGNDTLYGDHGDDIIYGNSGNDKLYGGQGKDTLIGGPGKDVIKQS